MRYRVMAFSAAALLCTLASAGDEPARFGRYMPLYPGFYTQATVSRDAHDRVFDEAGEERDSATPQLAGRTELPEQRLDAHAIWTFPLFEAAEVPFFRDRLHTIRLHWGYARHDSEGTLADFARDPSDDASTQADGLNTGSSGVTDLTLEFGSWLWGSGAWRGAQQSRHSLLLLGGVRLPTGVYDRDTPVNPGSNTAAFHVQLGFYGRPWAGGHFDAGIGHRAYLKNQDPAFGGLHPTNQGNDLYWDASFAQRFASGWYLSAFTDGFKGDANSYADIRFTPNPPPEPSTVPPSDRFPTPGVYQDGGTKRIRAGFGLQGFIAQRWLVGVHYVMPLSGRSGELDVPYSNRQPAGCTVGATGCNVTAGDTVHTDGLGVARVFASPSIALTLTLNFGQGDSYTCLGCEKKP
jgi:hypothetical protein